MSGIWRARLVAVIVETGDGGTGIGSGYLLDASHVLTAWHCTVDSKTRRHARLRVVRALDGAAAEVEVLESARGLDVALLAVAGDDPPPWNANLPGGPVVFGRLSRDRSGRIECEAAGFPRWKISDGRFRDVGEVHGPVSLLEDAESQRAVLRDPVLEGVTADDGSAWAGFSGAAVFHAGLLLGVVIKHDDRRGWTSLQFRPVQAIAEASDDAARRLAGALGIDNEGSLQLVGEPARDAAPQQQGWSLTNDEEGLRHWIRSGKGLSNRGEQGWRFRGRAQALRRVTDWLNRPTTDHRTLVVTGAPGAGKSAVLARVVTTADQSFRESMPPGDTGVKADVGSVSCAVHASGKTALEVATEIAAAASARPPAEPEDLVLTLTEALSGAADRFGVLIDALDEAASPTEARAIIKAVVVPLAETCAGARVIVGTRPRDDEGDLLSWFGPALDLVDLDTPAYFREKDLADYALACLQLRVTESPYTEEAVARPLARAIARAAKQNFLIAGLVARAHGMYDKKPVDPTQLRPVSSVRGSLDGYLERLSGVAGIPARRLLTALAFAEAPGLTAELWKLAVEALPPRSVREDWPVQVHAEQLDVFARSAAANFLLETRDGASPGGSGGPSYRLFHQALGEALLAAREEAADRIKDERALTQAFLAVGRGTEWEDSPPYLLRSLSAHAARAQMIDELLVEDAFLLHSDLRRLVPLADDAASLEGRRRGRLLRFTPRALDAAPAERAGLFSVTEALDDLGNSYRSGRWRAPYRALWANSLPRRAHTYLKGHLGPVNVACEVSVDDATLVATAGSDHTVRLWNPRTGEEMAILRGHLDYVNALCVVTCDADAQLASGSDDGTVRLWNLRTGKEARALVTEGSWRDRGSRVWVKAVCEIRAGSQKLLAGAGTDGIVRLWNPHNGELVRKIRASELPVWSMHEVPVEHGFLLATGSGDETVRLWNPHNGNLVHVMEIDFGRSNSTGGNQVHALCVARVDGRTVLAIGGTNVELWDPDSGNQIKILRSHLNQYIHSLCEVEIEGCRMLAGSTWRVEAQFWDPTGRYQTHRLAVQSGMKLMGTVGTGRRTFLACQLFDTVELRDIKEVFKLELREH